MQSNIIDMFSNDHTEKYLYHSLSDKIRYTVSCQDYSPVITPHQVQKDRDFQMTLIENFAQKLNTEINLLHKENCFFMLKFEKVIRIIYRVSRFNPELIILCRNMACENDTVHPVCNKGKECALIQLGETVKGMLKEQARKDGVIQDESGMEQLIFFMLEEVLKCFQSELTTCCQDMIDHKNETSFPSEEDMIERFYKPIAEQLGSMEAS